jgi:transposase InsO family protein
VRYGFTIRRKAVQLHLEEGIPVDLVAKEMGVSDTSVENWTRRYRKTGAAGLQDIKPGGRKNSLPGAVVEKIAELKIANPLQGARRISQVLRRLFCMRASPAAVQKHVKAKGLATPPKKKRKPQTLADRRFEYSKPNQFWQSDITMFTLLGKTAYIIGFIDDYSRYLTGLGIYRSQSAENVIETYRRAVGEYGVPEELLTDNGRQYANWRGKTLFQKELARDHVHHIRSRPQHPQTLGKIERLWQTLKDEFLCRAKFDTFESAQERLAFWVKHYNHHRPHQSLEGLCPADRYFEIRKEIKEVIERNMAANMEALALRGEPIEPFYMVGRMGDKSVVIETDKKKISVLVNGQAMQSGQTVLCQATGDRKDENGNDGGRRASGEESTAGIQREGEEPGGVKPVERAAPGLGADEGTLRALGHPARVGTTGDLGDPDGSGSGLATGAGGAGEPPGAGGKADRENPIAEGVGSQRTDELKGSEHEERGTGSVRSIGEVPGGAGDLDGTQKALGVVPGTGHQLQPAVAVAGPGGFGYVGSLGAAGSGRTGGTGAGPADQASAGSEDPGPGAGDTGARASEATGTLVATVEPGSSLNREVMASGSGRQGAGVDEYDPGSDGQMPDGDRGGRQDGSQPQDLLREGRPGLRGDAGRLEGSPNGPSRPGAGPGEGCPVGGTGVGQEGPGSAGQSLADPGGAPGRLAGIGSAFTHG